MSTTPLSIEIENRIRAVAHSLWLEEGQPDGRAESHWLKAVELVNAEAAAAVAAAKPAAKTKAASVAAAPKKSAAAAKKAAPRKRG